jgi:hypothetical protein
MGPNQEALMSTESMVTQADFEAIMDRLEKTPMNLTGKRWRDTPDDPALVELREHFILPIIEEYVRRHRAAAQPEREAVLEEAVKQALLQVEKYAEFFCEEDFDPLVDQLRSALTTPAPAVSTPNPTPEDTQ